ncbi:FmdB family zinc ribbon protein [Umezawaea endophytica]|uniref:FmdB family transcriptional regulator n=1 Tax=Umezawaea endophytica TaxID=1654476 RepID=A0A9X3AGC4_9PSEU|nr:FmdB family zinc ribbon protein [Umezawaea endophytica]MCS7479957.1 FmdB family transcriptional regulator [Umezawaea endophytica]
MPTYQYACTECDHRFDAVQSFTDSALSECPECHGRLRKLYGNVGVVFKGSGFYRTDSRSSTSTTTPAAASTPAATETKSSTPSTTTTPASTPAKAAS